MKYLFIILLFASCTTKQSNTLPAIHDTIYIESPTPSTGSIQRDTVYIPSSNDCSALSLLLAKKNDSLLVERYKVERVRYYARIVQKNSTQTKFLLGWILRAIKD